MNGIGEFYKKQLAIHSDKLKLRTKELLNSAVRLESWLKRNVDESIELLMSLERLDSLVKSYFYDIIRYKHFHGMLDKGQESKVNLQKIFSFTTKWILREKPLFALIDNINEDTKKRKNLIYIANIINELWAIYWMESSYFKLTGEKLNIKNERCNLSKTTKDHSSYRLFYLLKYRGFHESMFEELLNSKIKVKHEILEPI